MKTRRFTIINPGPRRKGKKGKRPRGRKSSSMARKKTPPRYPRGHKKAGQFMSARDRKARYGKKKKTSKRRKSRRRNPGRAGGTLVRANKGRRRTTKRRTTRKRTKRRRNPKMKFFPRTLRNKVGSGVGAAAALGSGWLSTTLLGMVAPDYNTGTFRGLSELAFSVLADAGAHMAPKKLAPLLDSTSVVIGSFGLAKILEDQFPAQVGGLLGVGNGNPLNGYASRMRRMNGSGRRRGVGAITSTGTPARRGISGGSRSRGVGAVTQDAQPRRRRALSGRKKGLSGRLHGNPFERPFAGAA